MTGLDVCEADDKCPNTYHYRCVYGKHGNSSCECRAGWSGTDCRTNADDCIGNECGNGLICVDMLGAYACVDPITVNTSRETTSWNPSPSYTRVPIIPTTGGDINTDAGKGIGTTAKTTEPSGDNLGKDGVYGT